MNWWVCINPSCNCTINGEGRSMCVNCHIDVPKNARKFTGDELEQIKPKLKTKPLWYFLGDGKDNEARPKY